MVFQSEGLEEEIIFLKYLVKLGQIKGIEVQVVSKLRIKIDPPPFVVHEIANHEAVPHCASVGRRSLLCSNPFLFPISFFRNF